MLDSAISVFTQGSNSLRLLEGLGVTLLISAISIILSMILGILVGMLMLSRWRIWKIGTRAYLESIRIMPTLVLLYLFYYSLSKSWDINLSGMEVALFAFTLWGTIEMADLVRGAVTSISRYQRESGKAIGLTDTQIYRYITIPQAIRRLVPGAINLILRMIKTTPLVFFIGVPELVNVGQQIVEVAAITNANYLASFWVYGVIFLIFFIICYPISRFSKYLERCWQC